MSRTCSVCCHKELATIQRLIGEGISLGEMSSRFAPLTKSALSRHMRSHTGRTRAQSTNASPRKSGPQSRTKGKSRIADDGRCNECGGMTTLLESDKLDGKALIWRAEKLLHLAERIGTEAKDAGDARLCLIALDRAQKSLDTLLRVSGLLKPDSVVVDARTVNVWASWSTPDLTALDGLKRGCWNRAR